MKHFTLLDGGLSRELQRLGAPFRQPEWSALSLIETPELVKQAHKNFIDAGADIITTNCYALVPYHIGSETYEARGEELMALAVEKASQAVRESGTKTRIAASLPPIFGSYRPNAFDVGGAIAIAQTLIEAQDEGTDLWLMETMGLLAEAQLYLTLLQEKGKAIWVSFTLDDTLEDGPPCLRSGELLSEAIDAMAGEVDAILINCSTVETIDNAVPVLVQGCRHIQCGIYANAFPRIDDTVISNTTLNTVREDVTPNYYAEKACGWVDHGVDIIGGCCGIGPNHIKAIDALRKREQA